MKVFDAWLNKEFEKALKDTKGYTRQQKINKVLTAIGLLIVVIVTLNIFNVI
jgi:hypothetical protein